MGRAGAAHAGRMEDWRGTEMIRVADYIADFINRQGVEDIFMLAGGGSIYLDDGVACHEHLNPVCVRNEATAPMMAEAYARLTGNLGAVYVTTGPGGANAVAGLTEAWVDSAPILVISGQVQRDQTSYNANIRELRTLGIQELNIAAIVASITKYVVMINDPEKIRYHLEKAVHIARTGRPGPVWLDIPMDVQSATVDESELEGYSPEPKVRSDIHTKEIIALLKKAKRPLVIAGQGIRIAGVVDKFKNLVENLGIPVVFSRLGQDLLPFSHPNNCGHGGMKGLPAAARVMKEADLVLSLGSRLAVPFVATGFADDATIVMVDLDEAELTKPGAKIAVPVQADVGDVITSLLDSDETLQSYDKWLRTCQKYKETYGIVPPQCNPIDLYYFISRLDALAGPNHVFVSDAGSSYYVTGQMLHFEHGQREITSGAFASMGLGIPLAIGCAIADKGAQVLAVTGDGSFELNMQELKTMAQYNLNVKLFVINNGGYASIRAHQDRLFEGRYIGSDYEQVLNFRKVANVFGLPYHLIESYEQVDSAIQRVTTDCGPALIEVVCDNNQRIIEPSKEPA